ncbi:MAG: uncharacterized protein KVP18_000267, partial [Porospora cf. gigantea A]|uniref:uncharacterized protein n=1 Tax=Porospora cf. gigantea A TaxID=2853593 RepID=UPI003559F666
MRKSKTNGNCTGRDAFTFDNLALAAGMFPDFAGSPHAVTNALEIAAFMANSSKETTGGWASEGYSGWGWCFAYEVGFPATSYGDQSNPNNSNCTSWWGTVTDSLTSQFDVRNKNRGYYGRGAFQLTHCYNYGWFRNWVETFLGLPRVPERDFLSNPGMVVKEWPFVSGMWFWMSPEEAGNKPSMHSITYMWEPNGELSVDNAGRSNDFGYLPNILNGGFECGSSGHHGPKIRVDYMAEYMEQMGVDTSQYQKQLQIDGGCVGKSNMASQTFKYWEHPDGSKDKEVNMAVLDFLKPGVVHGEDVTKLFNYCQEHKFALPAVNVTSTSSVNAVLECAKKVNSPVIIQVSNGGAVFFAGKSLDNTNQRAAILGSIAMAHHVNIMAEA